MSGDVTLEPTAGDGAPPGWRRAADTPTVRREASADGAVVVKAASGPGRDRLRHEAVVLRVLRGQRLVRLVELREDDRRTTLVMADAGSTSLDALAGDAARTAAALSATCEAVASLHAAGWSHGALETTHVLVGPRDRIRLCSLSRARTLAEHPSGRDGDRAALLRLVESCTGARPIRSGPVEAWRWRRFARRLAARTDRLPDGPDPRSLGRIIRGCAPRRHGARTGRARRVRRTVGAVAAMAVGLVGALVALALATADGRPDEPARPSVAARRTVTTSPAQRCPPRLPPGPGFDPSGCPGPVQVDGTTVRTADLTFRVGRPGDVVVVADADCDGTSTVTVLRPGTGETFDFPLWADEDGPATATLTTVVAGAVTLRPPTGRCGPVRIVLADGTERALGGTP